MRHNSFWRPVGVSCSHCLLQQNFGGQYMVQSSHHKLRTACFKQTLNPRFQPGLGLTDMPPCSASVSWLNRGFQTWPCSCRSWNVSKFSQNYANNLREMEENATWTWLGQFPSLCYPRKAVVHFRLKQIAVINQLKLFRLFLAISQRIVIIHNRHQWIQLLKVISTIS